MIFVHKLSYQLKSCQEFLTINNILDKYHFTKWHSHVQYSYLDGLSKVCNEFHIEVALDITKEKYAFGYGSKLYSEYVECKSLTDLYSKLEARRQVNDFARIMEMAVRDVQNAFNNDQEI